jgi:hypothetical protein
MQSFRVFVGRRRKRRAVDRSTAMVRNANVLMFQTPLAFAE